MARRIQVERETRGWSHTSLAARMTKAGCPMNQSAIWKIENGKPRRRITVDEAVGFGTVFKIPVKDLLVDVDVALGREVDDYFRHAVRLASELSEMGERAAELSISLQTVRALVMHTGLWDSWAVEAIDKWREQVEAVDASRDKIVNAMSNALEASLVKPALEAAREDD
jgi:transcriptional regulator with XRE-family HTH domain